MDVVREIARKSRFIWVSAPNEQYQGAAPINPQPKLPTKSRPQSDSSVKGSQMSINKGSQLSVNQAASVNQNAGGLSSKDNAAGENNEDEMWRAQLYKASVKLQKTPSDKRKNKPQVDIYL